MKLYAEKPGKALRQLITDLLVVLWIYLWIKAAMGVYDGLEKLAVPGEKLEGAGNGLAQQLRDAGGKVKRVPIAGDDLAGPFNKAGDAAAGVAEAGRQQQEIVHNIALAMSIGLLALTLSVVLLFWLPRRLRWIERASAAAKMRGSAAGKDLLALRALATQPLTKLAAIDPDIAAAWRRGDADAVDRLARLELAAEGLK
ncbi:hypothetical protein [Virgisporangium aurantiacum]|uniref:hypothetical protein n=1 Tax=Virgisporangium aurantiacum TaxID=175570 RepID=UPI00194EEF11|nr:hypothetical protein [Virgisporangium aurantiacum]